MWSVIRQVLIEGLTLCLGPRLRHGRQRGNKAYRIPAPRTFKGLAQGFCVLRVNSKDYDDRDCLGLDSWAKVMNESRPRKLPQSGRASVFPGRAVPPPALRASLASASFPHRQASTCSLRLPPLRAELKPFL